MKKFLKKYKKIITIIFVILVSLLIICLSFANKISKKKLWYYKQMAIIDCANKEVAIRTTTYYDLAEKPVDKINYEAYYLDWQSIVPESVGETIYHYVCGE